MSTDLDTNIRSFLARIEDATPMAPPLSMLRMTEQTVHHGRAIGIGVSAVVMAAGITGVAAVRLRDAPVAPAASVSVSSATSAPTTASTTAAATTLPLTDDPAGDRVMSANFYSLLDVQAPAELRTFLSGNVPEADVADCMHAAGYAYVEEPGEIDTIADDPRLTMSATDFAATYGFGSAADVLGLMPHQPLAVQAPNLAYVQTLSKEAQTQWFDAQHWCRGGYDTSRLEQGDAYTSAIEQFRELMRADPRIVEALTAWSSCMVATGHPFDDPQSMRDVLSQRALRIGVSTEELQQLFVDEIAVAVANVPCEAPYTATYRRVATERFTDFRSLYDAALSAP